MDERNLKKGIVIPTPEQIRWVMKYLLKNANRDRMDRGKPFISKKDIVKAWYDHRMGTIYDDCVIELAKKHKIVFPPKMGFAVVDRLIKEVIPQQKSGIKLRSMQWVISKPVRELIYKIVEIMENNPLFLTENINKQKEILNEHKYKYTNF